MMADTPVPEAHAEKVRKAQIEGEFIALKGRADPHCRRCHGVGHRGRNVLLGCLVPCRCTGISALEWQRAWSLACGGVLPTAPPANVASSKNDAGHPLNGGTKNSTRFRVIK